MESLLNKKLLEKYSLDKIMSLVQQKLMSERLNIDEKDEKISRKRELLSNMIKMAIAGDLSAKNFVIGRIMKILMNECEITPETIDFIIDFGSVVNLSRYLQFHIITMKYDISNLIDKYNEEFHIIDFTERTANCFSKASFQAIIEREYQNHNLTLEYMEKINVIANYIYAEVYGLSIIDRMEFMNINEIGVNGCNYVWVQHKGSKIWLEFLKYPDNSILNNVCKNAVSFNSKHDLSPSNPAIICQRYDGSRITCSLQPFYSEPTLNLRKFNLGNFNVDKLVKLGTIDEKTMKLLKVLISGRANVIIAGGMGDGKSTMLMTLINFVPGSRSIGTIEENLELRLKTRHPSKNIIEAQAVPGNPIAKAFEYMLKQSRDMIILGEITNSDEATLLINVMLRLCRGSMGTFHSENPKAAIINLRNLLLKSGSYGNEMVAQADVVEAVNVVLQMNHNAKGERFVDAIAEIEPVMKQGEVITSEFVPRYLMRRVNGKFVFENKISKHLLPLLLKYGATPEDIEEINKIVDEENANRNLQR